MSKLKLSEFNLYGVFPLKKEETYGIEDLVHGLLDDETFLSRSASYYPHEYTTVKFADLCAEYERLNSLLPASGKTGFVICEKMHELAIRVVNNIIQESKHHLYQDGENFDTVAQKCVQECADNLVRLFHDEPAQKVTTRLREETFYAPKDGFIQPKIVFMDNKKQMFMSANALPTNVEHLITPGRGSSKLGALVQSVRRRQGLKPLGFTQLYYSFYYNRQHGKVFKEPLKDLPESVLVMDDVIVNGHTVGNIKEELTAQGHDVLSGAVTSSFEGSVFRNGVRASNKNNTPWHLTVDLIPNQYLSSNAQDQGNLFFYLRRRPMSIGEIMKDDPRNSDGTNSADYIAMQQAESITRGLGEDLYTPSTHISPECAEYNKKVRDQVYEYNY